MKSLFFYRFEYSFHSSLGNTYAEIKCLKFNLLKETDKGYWIGHGSLGNGKLRSNGHWVSKTSKRRFAFPSEIEALTDLHARIGRREYILTNQMQGCKSAKRQVEVLQREILSNEQLTK